MTRQWMAGFTCFDKHILWGILARMKHSHILSTCAVMLCALAPLSQADVITNPTTDTDALAAALQPEGLTITSVTLVSGLPGQFGTYSHFILGPATISNGIVLSSGDVTNMAPFPEQQDPNYDPAWPPPQINTQMYPWEEDGSTPEFLEYGSKAGHIENFYGCYDVAAIRVEFELPTDSQIQFDFIFGSVEYPYWTSSYTDAFLVFLDGTSPDNQITYDANGSAVQVGSSFAGLETTEDLNTAFSAPHGLIHHLTTTSPKLRAGKHVLYFEVGDVNDHILDSAVFITHLRTGSGSEGTGSTEDPPCLGDINEDGIVDGTDLGILLGEWGEDEDSDLNGDHDVDGTDLGILLGNWGQCPAKE